MTNKKKLISADSNGFSEEPQNQVMVLDATGIELTAKVYNPSGNRLISVRWEKETFVLTQEDVTKFTVDEHETSYVKK